MSKVESPVSVKTSARAARTPKTIARRNAQRSRQMSELASKRWAERGRTEAELREYFETAPLDEILEEFSTMRRHYEMAGTILNQRVQKERNVEACANCGRAFSKDVPWFNREVVKDPETGIITNIFSCSQACFIALKRKENNPRLVRKQ